MRPLAWGKNRLRGGVNFIDPPPKYCLQLPYPCIPRTNALQCEHKANTLLLVLCEGSVTVAPGRETFSSPAFSCNHRKGHCLGSLRRNRRIECAGQRYFRFPLPPVRAEPATKRGVHDVFSYEQRQPLDWRRGEISPFARAETIPVVSLHDHPPYELNTRTH